MTATKAICVWYDETSDPSNPAWIVSEDRIDEAGRADTSRTLSTHDGEHEAMSEGRAVAAKRGLPLYRNPENGPAVLVQAAE